MKTTFLVRTRSGFGTALAAVLLCVLLVLVGVWVATNGEIVGVGRALGASESSLLAKWEAGAAVFKSQGRLTLLVILGGMVVLLGGLVAPLGAFIRTFEYRFDRRRGTLVRRSLWCFLPAWIAGLIGAGGAAGALWARGVSGYWAIAICVGYAGFASAICTCFPRVRRWAAYVPGGGHQIPMSLIKLVEIEKASEGGLALVVGRTRGRKHVLRKGPFRRLEKLV